MRDLALWEGLLHELQLHQAVGLLVVVESIGSSPGRQGFKMMVSKAGGMNGSVGGGIMEHKLVELMRSHLLSGLDCWEIRRQIHSKQVPHDQSGMICSGEQKLALLTLHENAIPKIHYILDCLREGHPCLIQFDEKGFQSLPFDPNVASPHFSQEEDQRWQYREVLGLKDVAHVIGAGHVGLEMCKILAGMDFYVVNYDDRCDLNTMTANEFAHKKIVTPYPEIAKYIETDRSNYVIVMTFGYRGDDEAVRALLGRTYKYFGMMGSEAKVAKMLKDLHNDGYDEQWIQQIHAPAGLVAHCKTPSEIAVSIAAEIIAIRNKSCPASSL